MHILINRLYISHKFTILNQSLQALVIKLDNYINSIGFVRHYCNKRNWRGIHEASKTQYLPMTDIIVVYES